MRPEILQPPLTLDSWRIIASAPRYIIVTCTDARLPLTICAAHAPHAERPNSEANSFWDALQAGLLKAPSLRGLVVGIDANGDFYAADEQEALVGDLLAAGEPDRNDSRLLELCVRLGLSAPATFRSTQYGPGWSWQHPSGVRKRIDHVLFREGPWTPLRTSQALDFDLCTAHKDHVPLRAVARLCCPAAVGRCTRQRRARPQDVLEHGDQVWRRVRQHTPSGFGVRDRVADFLTCHSTWCQALPDKRSIRPKQPYLRQRTLTVLSVLRDWRFQLRFVAETHRKCRLLVLFRGWQTQDRSESLLAAARGLPAAAGRHGKT